MEILHVTEKTFQEVVIDSTIPVLVDFFADWCAPCKMLAPVIAEVAEELEGKVKVVKMNVDDAGAIAGQYQVMSIPTCILFESGIAVKRLSGFMPKPALLSALELKLT